MHSIDRNEPRGAVYICHVSVPKRTRLCSVMFDCVVLTVCNSLMVCSIVMAFSVVAVHHWIVIV